jgi:hypothetical protein
MRQSILTFFILTLAALRVEFFFLIFDLCSWEVQHYDQGLIIVVVKRIRSKVNTSIMDGQGFVRDVMLEGGVIARFGGLSQGGLVL